MYDRILLPADGSEVAETAASRAVGLASLAGAELHVLYVVDARDALAVALLLLVPLVAAGAVAATPPADDRRLASTDDGGPALAAAVDPGDYDEALASGETHWAGQRLYFDASAVVPDAGNASARERTVQLRRVTEAGEAGPLVREFVVDADGEAVVDVGSLSGEFVLRYDGDPVYVRDGRGYTATTPDGTAVTVENSAWEVAVQTISASWSEARVTRNAIVALRVESNRVLYQVEVSAEGLDFEDLERIFDPHSYALDHDARADDDVILLRGGLAVDVPAYFAGIDDGEYALSIEVADADAATTAVVRVGGTRTVATTTRPPRTTTPSPETVAATTAPPEAPATAAPGSTAFGPTATATTGQPGFGAPSGALALAAATFLSVRRRW